MMTSKAHPVTKFTHLYIDFFLRRPVDPFLSTLRSANLAGQPATTRNRILDVD